MNSSVDFAAPAACARRSSDAPIRVLKFGGTSVADAARIRRVVEIVRKAALRRRVVVVVSAMAEVTNTLESILLERRTDRAALLLGLYRRHVQAARELLSTAELARYRGALGDQFAAILPSLRRLKLGVHTRFDGEALLAAGERFAVPLLAACLRETGLGAEAVDGSHLIRTGHEPDGVRAAEAHHEVPAGSVDFHATRTRILAWYEGVPEGRVPVVTGYVAASTCGRTVTLGRGGSDFSASLIASALNAEVLERWTDVDGLYERDPRHNRRAARYRVLRLEDAAVLNGTVGLGMHRHTLAPLISSRVPLRVRSVDSADPGTLVIPSSSNIPART